MPILQSRRDFLANASMTASLGAFGSRACLADEGPPEVTTIRLRRDPSICAGAPLFVAETLLRAEGFSEIQYVPVQSGPPAVQAIRDGEIDFGTDFAGVLALALDAGAPIAVLSGLHTGCFELFAHEPIRTISELKSRKVGINTLGSGQHIYIAIMAASVGLDPHKDIEWVEGSADKHLQLFPMELFIEREVDAFLGFPPEPQELRSRKIGRVIVNTTADKPWSQYFCCMLFGNGEFVRSRPLATKRLLRALLKANDVCAAEPEQTARRLVDVGFAHRYDYALQTLSELPYGAWREFDPEDSLRYYALRLHEVGMISSSPNKIIAEGTDWRFLNELKRELKT
jgi:NitT/TauT family transport system substrate-binding protein